MTRSRIAALALALIFVLAAGWNAAEQAFDGQSAQSGSTAYEVGSYADAPISELVRLEPGFEAYSPEDGLGRCGPAVAMIGPETLPADGQKRDHDSLSKIRPSGWDQEFYPDLITASNGALFNRCHLIAFSLAAEEANALNLITGTRQMNEAMTTYEQQLRAYVAKGGHVAYRVTPDFQGRELVARGVRMEALSVEDGGKAVSFDVYIPNEQDGVEIDYEDGSNRRAG